MRYVVTDSAGNILRHGWATNPAAQAGAGEEQYAVESQDYIDDTAVKIGPAGFEPAPGYEGPVPSGAVVRVSL